MTALDREDPVQIREASPKDIDLILGLIGELAKFEKLSNEAVADRSMGQFLFEEPKRAECLIAEYEGKAVGFSLFFYNFSTFLGRPGIYIEDLYVKPELRGKGIGTRLFQKITMKAYLEKCGRIEFSVLDWNRKAIDFYKKLGAKPMDEWTVYRLENKPIYELAHASEGK